MVAKMGFCAEGRREVEKWRFLSSCPYPQFSISLMDVTLLEDVPNKGFATLTFSVLLIQILWYYVLIIQSFQCPSNYFL
jgi:apolipoprotein N-acyltransferase